MDLQKTPMQKSTKNWVQTMAYLNIQTIQTIQTVQTVQTVPIIPITTQRQSNLGSQKIIKYTHLCQCLVLGASLL